MQRLRNANEHRKNHHLAAFGCWPNPQQAHVHVHVHAMEEENGEASLHRNEKKENASESVQERKKAVAAGVAAAVEEKERHGSAALLAIHQHTAAAVAVVAFAAAAGNVERLLETHALMMQVMRGEVEHCYDHHAPPCSERIDDAAVEHSKQRSIHDDAAQADVAKMRRRPILAQTIVTASCCTVAADDNCSEHAVYPRTSYVLLRLRTKKLLLAASALLRRDCRMAVHRATMIAAYCFRC